MSKSFNKTLLSLLKIIKKNVVSLLMFIKGIDDKDDTPKSCPINKPKDRVINFGPVSEEGWKILQEAFKQEAKRLGISIYNGK